MGYPSEDYEVVDRLARQAASQEIASGHRDDWTIASDLEKARDEIAADAIANGAPLITGTRAAIVDADTMIPLLTTAVDALRKNILGMKLALMHSEISEALERLRDVGAQSVIEGDEEYNKELADIVIRALGHSDLTGASSIGTTLVEKMAANKDRPRHHGRAA